MKRIVAGALLLFCGCRSIHRLSDGAEETRNLIVNSQFDGAAVLDVHGPDDDLPVCDGWQTHGGGTGVRPQYRIEPTGNVIRMTVSDVGSGLSNGVRIYQRLEQFHPLATLVGRQYRASVDIRTLIPGRVQFVFSASIPTGSGHVARYSTYAQGTGEWERLSVTLDVPPDTTLLWLKIGMTTADVTLGEFEIRNPVVEEIGKNFGPKNF